MSLPSRQMISQNDPFEWLRSAETRWTWKRSKRRMDFLSKLVSNTKEYMLNVSPDKKRFWICAFQHVETNLCALCSEWRNEPLGLNWESHDRGWGRRWNGTTTSSHCTHTGTGTTWSQWSCFLAILIKKVTMLNIHFQKQNESSPVHQTQDVFR